MAKDLLKVQTDRSHNKFIGRETFVDHIRVIHDVAAEDQTSADSIHDVHRVAEGDEDADDAGHDCRVLIDV